MISKSFYLENLSAFDILIQDDRENAQKVIFRVFSILQRDKIWLREVATEEEIFEEDEELLAEVEEELKELDLKYDFRFDDFYKLVQQKMKQSQLNPDRNVETQAYSEEDIDLQADEEDDVDSEELDDLDFASDEEEEEDFYEEKKNRDELSHISDEELDQITDHILESAKTRFDYAQFLKVFPQVDEYFVEEQIIFPLIAGKSHEETNDEIAEKIKVAFKTLGLSIDSGELVQMVAQKGKELGLEILAFGIAADSLQQGADPREVLNQITQLLNK